ncbi:MAG: type V CRISPR-associated protein Cas12k [Cyanobacteria bacterium J06633_8]
MSVKKDKKTSIKTIQCRLVANEEVLRHVWELMKEKNTPLINEIFHRLKEYPNFEQWLEKGQVPDSFIKELCQSLKKQEPFAGQPGRFYTSAETMVKEVYKSWFALQQKRKRKLDGKKRYLAMLRSDIELQKESNFSLESIRAKANDILVEVREQFDKTENDKPQKKENKNKKNKKKFINNTLFFALFDIYDKTEDILSKCALAYLLKNQCNITNEDENEDKYNLYRRRKEIEIERLTDQLKSKRPNGRDLNSNTFFETLEIISNSFTVDENEFKSWQANLLKTPSNLPYPVDYETNEDLTWLFNTEERIYVSFTALGDKRENSRQVDKHKFEVWCDKRHLHFFKRFVEDINVKKQGDKKNSQKQYSAGLLTFRSK